MKKIIYLLLFFLLGTNQPIRAAGVNGDAQISGEFDGSPIVVKTASWVTGAIDSLTWKGKNFVYSDANGQQIQTALTVNNWGECYNPTESGTASDNKGPTSSSTLQSISGNNNILETTTQMAFWLDPTIYTGSQPGCFFDKSLAAQGKLWAGGYVLNSSVLSDFVLQKKVTIGYKQLSNVIQYESTITIPTDLKLNIGNLKTSTGLDNPDATLRYLILQNPAVFLTNEFSQTYRYDPKLLPQKESLTATTKEITTTPPILATPDEQFAIGVYTPEITPEGWPDNPEWPHLGYQIYDWRTRSGASTMATGMRIPKSVSNPGRYTYKSYLIIGTLTNVLISMHALYTETHPVGDINTNGTIEIEDLKLLIRDIGKTGNPGFLPSDLNTDGRVDIFDFSILVSQFGSPQ